MRLYDKLMDTVDRCGWKATLVVFALGTLFGLFLGNFVYKCAECV